jgi:hypothetical protein
MDISTGRKRSARITNAKHILPIEMSHSFFMRTTMYHSKKSDANIISMSVGASFPLRTAVYQ